MIGYYYGGGRKYCDACKVKQRIQGEINCNTCSVKPPIMMDSLVSIWFCLTLCVSDLRKTEVCLVADKLRIKTDERFFILLREFELTLSGIRR